MALTETTTRTLVAAVGVPAAVGVVLLGGWVLAGLLAGVAFLAVLEFFRLAETKGVRALRGPGVVVAVLFVLLAALAPERGPDGVGFATLMVVAALGIPTAAIWARGTAGQPLLAASATLAGAVYTGALLSFALFLRHLPGHVGMWHGAALVLAPVVLTWSSDTFAYFAGRQWGRRKLIPAVSPGKTVEGAAGAVIGTVLVAVLYAQLLAPFPTYTLAVWQAVLLGLLISVAAQLGDLAESLFKRDAGVKDSGKLLPGHGGALDRFDSLLFTLPAGYFFFRVVVAGPQAF
jgi:phosphatidate cytidylyltransferase